MASFASTITPSSSSSFIRPGYAALPPAAAYTDDIPALPPLSVLPIAAPAPAFDSVALFRCALGINAGLPTGESASVSQCRRHSQGIYQVIVTQARRRRLLLFTVKMLVNLCHVAQIVGGALLTALGPAAASHGRLITLLGAANTILAGILALIKGQGLSERLYAQQAEFRRAQDWIEETEALMVAGLVGADREETGRLIETAFEMYNRARNLQDFGPTKETTEGDSQQQQQQQRQKLASNNVTAQGQGQGLTTVVTGRV